ncbi:MAG: serine hydrolase domain-containing protein [Bacillota bacterium]
MFKRMLYFALLIFWMSGGNNVFAASDYSAVAAVARNEAWKAIGNGASAVTVAVMSDGEIVYAEAFGMTDRTRAIPADTNTQFNIGSISKVFTAAAILQLCEQGKVKLDSAVTEYLPEFSMRDQRYRQITVRMLLNHTSGMPGTNFYNSLGDEKNHNYVTETLACLADGYLKSEPGAVSVYCNDGFTLAGAVIERVSGLSYAAYLDKNIFGVAGMTNSSCYYRTGNANIARTYDNYSGFLRPVEYVNIMAGGGIASTAVDLCRFSEILTGHKLLKQQSIQEFRKQQTGPETTPSGEPETAYGIGWDDVACGDFTLQGVTVLGKGGGSLEFTSELLVAPDAKLSVATILAVRGGDAIGMSNKIMQMALETKGILKPNTIPVSLPLPIAALPETLNQYAGIYAAGNSVAKISFDKLQSTLNREPLVDGKFVPQDALVYKTDEKFQLNDTGGIFFFSKDGTDYMLGHNNSSGRNEVIATKVNPATTAPDCSEFAGMTWMPRNYQVSDFAANFMTLAKSGTISELPGRVFLKARNLSVYGLQDKFTGKMILPHARDLVDIRISYEAGVKILQVDNFQYTDAGKVQAWRRGEKIIIGNNGYNVARAVAGETLFSCAIPRGGRLIAYNADGVVSFDSLFADNKTLVLESGSYLLFIGHPGAHFATR